MKKNILVDIGILLILLSLIFVFNYIDGKKSIIIDTTPVIQPNEKDLDIVYDGLTMEELAAKLDRSLKDDLAGSGIIYAKYSLEYGVDPYLAVAISLHETGCNNSRNGCSSLVSECNNVGGQKFRPTCYAGGSMGRYDTLEEGIEGFIRNIYNNYIAMGLDTPLKMEKKYAGGSNTWASKVEVYIENVKGA